MSHEPIRVGIIGAGRIGRVHAETLSFRLADAKVEAIADVSFEAAKKVADDCGISKATSSIDEVFADRGIQAVLICSSTPTHTQLIIRAADVGKHIFCEKPIAFDLGEIDKALAAVRAAGVNLQIGFNRRFDSNFVRVRKAVVEGEIGTPSLLHIISRDPQPPSIEYIRNSGGIFMDMTIHDFDMARFLVGDEVEEIYAAGGVMVDPKIGEEGDLDTALVTLRFRNGALGTIDNSRRSSYGYDQRVELFGSKGKIATENVYPDQAVVSDAQSIRRGLPLNFFMDRYKESFANELASFISAIREKRPTEVTGIDGRYPVVMAMAARRSYDERRPVRLAEISPEK